jgi:hypothetical protein
MSARGCRETAVARSRRSNVSSITCNPVILDASFGAVLRSMREDWTKVAPNRTKLALVSPWLRLHHLRGNVALQNVWDLGLHAPVERGRVAFRCKMCSQRCAPSRQQQRHPVVFVL